MKKVLGGMATYCVTNADCASGAECHNHSCCRAEYSDACAINGAGNPEDQCCAGLKCELNATGTGTICVPA